MEQSNKDETNGLNLGDPGLEALIRSTIHRPLGSGYIMKCYCKSCYGSYDVTKNGISLLERKNPNQPITLPEGISDLRDREQSKNCFLVLSNCFFCQPRQPIVAEAKLIPPSTPPGSHNGKRFYSHETLNDRERTVTPLINSSKKG